MVKAQDDIFFTLSMAEVLEKQGHLEDALVIYMILAESSPQDETLRSRIDGLKDRARKKRGGGASPRVPSEG